MKYLLIFLMLIMPAFAQDAELMKSETGVVESIKYQDVEGIPSTKETVKQEVLVRVTSGDFKGIERIIDNVITGNPAYDINLSKGNHVILHLEPVSDIVAGPEDVNFYIADVKRDSALWVFAGIFCLALIAVGRKKGVNSLISIIVTVGLIFFMLVPMILSGLCPIASAVLVCILAAAATIYLVGGFNPKSTSAVFGIILSLIIAGGLSMLAIKLAHLTGFAGEENLFLYAVRPDLDFTGILSASIIIAALGALMDTGISIASTINELHETDTCLGMKALFHSGMNVGKDIIGTMSNTLILVYLGAALPL
ncbi:MAG: YibE/F family protein, partial [Heliobacteriaceae bacterium]|nr:YibE/F family protein [Heliobacteriaceae bacterium]